MDPSSPKIHPSRLLLILPWLYLLGGLLAFVLISLFAAIHSDLAREISTGESPTFAWAKAYTPLFLFFGFVYFLGIHGVQRVAFRLEYNPHHKWIEALVWSEVVALGLLAMGFLNWWRDGLVWGHILFQISILLQALLALWRSERIDPYPLKNGSIRPEMGSLLFLLFLFVLAAIPARLDPSWNRMQAYVHLDSSFEGLLSQILPPLLSGVTGLWFGIGTLAVLAGFRALQGRVNRSCGIGGMFFIFPFLSISGLYAVIWLESLVLATDWEIRALDLKPAIIPLFILLCGSGGLLFSAAFQRIVSCGRQTERMSQIGAVALAMGSVLVFPLTWILTRPGCGRWSWRFLLFSCLVGSLLLGAYVLYGGLFDPWFTAFSYLKAAVLKATAVISAGIMVLLYEELFGLDSVLSTKLTREWAIIGIVFFVGFLPFVFLERHRETKVAVLQFNELNRVDAAYARAVSNFTGINRWVRLGQAPKINHSPEQWPLPWRLEKTHPSLLPKDFNLLVIVVDALRGDAFHSSGYSRNLTPFLDRWALEEAVSFRRAYSQGGGSFAAVPFLFGGRSRFNLYGPEVHRENLYFKLARAEGIDKVMMVREFGPRAIFPPHFPVIELGGSKSTGDRRSVPADEVFAWAKDAIDRLARGERFFCLLYLMDVHNDLWKKEGGLDFGNTPRDLYDNNLSYIDKAFERFVSWLEKKGIYDRTIILFTSDHGEQFWEHGASLHGHTLYEEEIRIPLILFTHGIRKRVEDIPVVSSDVAPTLADLAGYSIDPPYKDSHMGISLVPLLLENERDSYLYRDIVGRASFKRRYFLYRNWEWKLVYFAELDLLQLFNTYRDPMERRNLIEEELDLTAELERNLLQYLEKVERKTYRPLLSTDWSE